MIDRGFLSVHRQAMKRKVLLVVGVAAISAAVGVRAAQSSAPSLPTRAFQDGTFRVALRQTVNGEVWTVGRISNNLSEVCYQLNAPAGWRVRSCLPATYDFARQPVVTETSGTADVSILVGIAAPQVERVRLVRADCSVRDLAPAADGLFMSVSPATSPAPYSVRAFDRAGAQIVARGLTERGLPAPSPSAC